MGVNVCRRGNIAVAKPLLNFLEIDAACIQQTGAAVSQVVIAYDAHAMLDQKGFEVFRDMIRMIDLAQGIDVDVLKIILAIGSPTKPLILTLLLFHI